MSASAIFASDSGNRECKFHQDVYRWYRKLRLSDEECSQLKRKVKNGDALLIDQRNDEGTQLHRVHLGLWRKHKFSNYCLFVVSRMDTGELVAALRSNATQRERARVAGKQRQQPKRHEVRARLRQIGRQHPGAQSVSL